MKAGRGEGAVSREGGPSFDIRVARPLSQRRGCSGHRAQAAGVDRVKTEADRFAANVMPVIREAQRSGASSLRAIADVLNARGVRTARGGKWAATQVRDILRRTR
jgi:hypothetical protein